MAHEHKAVGIIIITTSIIHEKAAWNKLHGFWRLIQHSVRNRGWLILFHSSRACDGQNNEKHTGSFVLLCVVGHFQTLVQATRPSMPNTLPLPSAGCNDQKHNYVITTAQQNSRNCLRNAHFHILKPGSHSHVDVDYLWRQSLQCSWTSSLDKSDDGPSTDKLVIQLFKQSLKTFSVGSVERKRTVNPF